MSSKVYNIAISHEIKIAPDKRVSSRIHLADGFKYSAVFR